MSRLRRFASLLALPILFQLVLGANAVACTDQASVSTAAHATTSAMPGMDMSQPERGKSSQSDHSRQTPCDRPLGPSNCQPLAPCASGALVADDVVAPQFARIACDPSVLVVLTPRSHTTRPELPPPRA